MRKGMGNDFDQLDFRVSEIERYKNWLDSVQARGCLLTKYECPLCSYEIHTRYPDEDDPEPWDSLSSCPNCGVIHWKNVFADKFVVASTCK